MTIGVLNIYPVLKTQHSTRFGERAITNSDFILILFSYKQLKII